VTSYRTNDTRREAVARVLVLARAAIDTLNALRRGLGPPELLGTRRNAEETHLRWDDARQSMRALEIALREIDVPLEPEFALLDRSASVPDPVGLWQRFQASMRLGPWEDGQYESAFVVEAITRLSTIVHDLETEMSSAG
jgi:hypothetical protein